MRTELLLPIIVVILVYTFVFFRTRKRIENFVFLTWFRRKTKIYSFRKIIYLCGVALLLISLLDFRGPEEKIESDIPDQKTIVIIDSSASMLAEDVRPNRFQKSLIMARHFVKKAYGHKIAVVLFSDQQKRLVPFTDDLDLLDGRIAGLESIDLSDGGSNISQAIKESISYFKTSADEDGKVTGNILVFTDSEGHDEDFSFSLPKTVTLGIVGVGTLQGSKIPMRDNSGVFRGYKKFENQDVISKLNENWLKSLKNKIENYNYWIANSYTIPTEEIISFFNSNFEKRLSKGLTTVRPVEVEPILVPGLILLIISFFLYPTRNFKFVFMLMAILSISNQRVIAQDKQVTEEELEQSKKELEALSKLMEKHKTGLINRNEKMKLAEMLSDNENYEMANTLYEESINELSPEDQNNYAINLIKNKSADQAIKVLSDLQLNSDKNQYTEDFEKGLRQNLLLALAENKKQQQQKEQDEKEEQKKKENKEKGKSGESSEEQKDNQSEQSDGGDNQKNDQEKKDTKDSKKEKDNKKDSEDENDGEEKQDEKKEAKPKDLKEKQSEIERKRKMVKIPGLIKQLMSDDRNLQKKYIDTSTDKPKSFKKKDW